MTNEATQFMAEALKRVDLDGGFAPEEIGKRIGMSKMQSELVARSLSDAGVLVLGFDCQAEFSPEYRKMTEATTATAAAQVKVAKKAEKVAKTRRQRVSQAA